MLITYVKNGTNVDNSSESADRISFENKMSVTAAAIYPAVKKVLNNALKVFLSVIINLQ